MKDFFEKTKLKGNVLASQCPSRQVLQTVTSRWGVLVLVALQGGTKRFSELKRSIDGVSERMLAQTLQNLEQHHIIDRKDFQTVPPHVEYSLTPAGVQIAIRVRELVSWLEENWGELAKD